MKLNELTLDDQDQLLQAPMNEMANLYPMKTGLPVVLWFGEVGGQHGPRIKVSNIRGKFAAHDTFVISVTHEPKVLTPKSASLDLDVQTDIIDWIKLNYDILMEMWKLHETGDGDLETLLAKLQKI